MPVVSSYHFLLGPLVAVAALGVILLICRWVFAVDHRPSRAVSSPTSTELDHGLLVPLTTVRTEADAAMLRDVLRAAGIRAGTTLGEQPGEHVVTVFSQDIYRARALVGTS